MRIICTGVFDAQPTASERQRENLSSRLRREFGLALPDDEEARPPTDNTGMANWTLMGEIGCSKANLGQHDSQASPFTHNGAVSGCDSGDRFFTTHNRIDSGVVGYNTNTSNYGIVPFEQMGYNTSYEYNPMPKGLKWGRRGV